MKWSRFNFLFRSDRFGWMIYNSASNAFLQLDEATYREVAKIRDDIDDYRFDDKPGLYVQLRMNGVLVEDGFDRAFLNRLKFRRLANNFDNARLFLTIAPTLACNLDCVYCYQREHTPRWMDAETEDRLVAFVERHRAARSVHVTWYGGEPLLGWDQVRSLTTRFRQLGKKYSADIITNGFLLDAAKIAQLGELDIDSVQITVDGVESTHDRRRIHRDGSGTWARIVGNTEALLRGWTGQVSIRVNIDNANEHEYHLIHRTLRERFSEFGPERVRIYPGIVHDGTDIHPDVSCFHDRSEEADFNIRQYERHGIDDFSFFPAPTSTGCIAAHRNGYVIGPRGEIYKCWNDMGVEERVIGSVHPGEKWNADLQTEYLVGSSYLEDPECQECAFLPVCDGGCLHVRLKNRCGNGACVSKRNVCFKFKDRLERLLEVHYEKKLNQAGPAAVAETAQG